MTTAQQLHDRIYTKLTAGHIHAEYGKGGRWQKWPNVWTHHGIFDKWARRRQAAGYTVVWRICQAPCPIRKDQRHPPG